ncbi:MAG: DUF4330 domain-containing protein [Firmicutes bacterium]|nr:DUF4330 domain-containing protein [Bacillota bacterium]
MKFIDENGRVGGKVNLVDLIVLILALLVIVVIVARLGVVDKAEKSVDQSMLTYSVRIENVRPYTVDAIQEGDAIYDSKDSVCIGTIKEVEAVQATTAVRNTAGEFAIGEEEGRYDLFLTVETPVETTNGRHFVNGTHEISANSRLEARTKYAKFTAMITEIK